MHSNNHELQTAAIEQDSRAQQVMAQQAIAQHVKNGTFTAIAHHRIPFFDIDPMNIAWHGHYVKYFELGRCALLNAIEYNYQQMHDSGYAWPVVDMRLKYIKPAKLDMEIMIRAQLTEWENRLKLQYTIFDAATEQKLTTGYTLQVAVNISNQDMCFITPTAFRNALFNYCAQ